MEVKDTGSLRLAFLYFRTLAKKKLDFLAGIRFPEGQIKGVASSASLYKKIATFNLFRYMF